MPNVQKQQTVSELRDIVAQSKGAILTEYRGLTVAEVTALRKKLRDVEAEYHIVKNTLFKLALGDALSPDLENLLKGPIAIAFARQDVVAPTKAVLDFLRDLRKPEIQVKGGWIDGKIYTVDQVTALSKLPPKEQIVAQLVGTLNGPVSEFVSTLDNILGTFVRTIEAIKEKIAESGSAAAAPVAEAPAAEAPVVETSASETPAVETTAEASTEESAPVETASSEAAAPAEETAPAEATSAEEPSPAEDTAPAE